MMEGVQQGPVLVGTFFMVAEEYLPPTAAPGTWALMSPAEGRPGCRSWSPWSRRRTLKPEKSKGHGLDMEDLASMCEKQCRKACNLHSAAEELEETGSNGRARRYRKRGSPKPAAEARAMETDPSPVRPWSAADSEGHYEGYRTAYPSESEKMAIPSTRAHTAPKPSLDHDAKALERPTRARTAPVARHTEPTRDNMCDTPMAEESEAPGTVGCA